MRYALGYIDDRYEDGDLWVVTDVRFENEAEAMDRTALIMASAETRAGRVGITEQELAKRSTHASEVLDFDTDFAIWNDPHTVLPQDLLAWLGLPWTCLKCAFLEPHTWHDGGQSFE